MKLIARKPCSFGGRNFFIGEEVPADLVLDPKKQEAMEILSIVNTPDSQTKPAGKNKTGTETGTDKTKKTRGGKAKPAGER